MEPAFSPEDISFCLWRGIADQEWRRAEIPACPPGYDGTEWLLELFDGRPESYRAFAASYFEVQIGLDEIAAVYAHRPLTPQMVVSLNNDAAWEAVQTEAQQIGYPVSEPA